VNGPTRLGDDGFGVVELLMALAIAAVVVLGIGALFTAVGSLADRTRQASTVMTALMDLQGMTALAGEETGLDITDVSAAGFGLHRPAQRTIGTTVITTAKLHVLDGRNLLELGHGTHTSSVDLSVFDKVSLEYFQPHANAGHWVHWNEVDSKSVVGVRLVLSLGPRVWRPLLWVGDVYR
jgi:hypothetical protein